MCSLAGAHGQGDQRLRIGNNLKLVVCEDKTSSYPGHTESHIGKGQGSRFDGPACRRTTVRDGFKGNDGSLRIQSSNLRPSAPVTVRVVNRLLQNAYITTTEITGSRLMPAVSRT
jgi:hypothetical protein